MTIRVSPEVKPKLDRLAVEMRRTKSFLTGEAVAAYILAYEITVLDAEERRTIVRMIHTARDWPRADWPK